jgi:hypothetical protein
MPSNPQSKPSFSLARRLGIGLQVFVLIALVFAVVVMVNYISRDYFLRFQTSAQHRIELAPLTVNLLKSLTNQVTITLYYDKKDPMFSTVSDLVKKYGDQNPKHVKVQEVDYLLDAGSAQKVKEEYGLGATTNLIIFKSSGNPKALPVPGSTLSDFAYENAPGGFRQKLVAFRGETVFTAALLAVTESKSLHAYVLQGHGEHGIDSGDETDGYIKFAGLMGLYRIEVHRLDTLAALPGVPTNCDLLIIPGPRESIPPTELTKIEQYLDRSGSRLMVLLDASGLNRQAGLENILAKWGVRVGNKIVADPKCYSKDEGVIVVSAFSVHPVVSPIFEQQTGICLVRPRPVLKVTSRGQPADAPHVQELAFTSDQGCFEGDETHKGQIPLMVAVEKSIPGVATDRGPTRLLVLGDSFCLANNCIRLLGNHNFAAYAVNWLTDRSHLVQIPPNPMADYTVYMTKSQLQSTELILLAGMPGGVLFLGMLVWLRRRR